jgi:hypothetical protein
MAKYPKAAPVKKKPVAPAKKPAAPAEKKPAVPAKPKPRKREGDAEDADSVPLARLMKRKKTAPRNAPASSTRRYIRWTDEQVEALTVGFEKHQGRIDDILADPALGPAFRGRGKSELSAKCKNLGFASPRPRGRARPRGAAPEPTADKDHAKTTSDRRAPGAKRAPSPSSSDDSDSSSDDASASEEAAKPTAAAAANWTVRIRWRGDELPLSIASDCTTDALKRLIDAKTGGRLPPERCALSYRGEPLVDGGALLARAGVVDGDAFDLRIAAATPPRPNAALSSGALAVSNLGAGAGATGPAAASPSNARLPLGHVGSSRRFSEAEARKLLEGVETHGAGRWAAIQKWGFGPEERTRDAGIQARTQVDLKDKWRNMVAMTRRPEGFKFRAKYVTEAFLRRVSVAAENAEARTKETETKESEELARRREMVRLAWEKRQRAASE